MICSPANIKIALKSNQL